MTETNPYKSNQYVLDPRQKLCWEFYINPKSETFGNALQSALKAGYEETYSTQITATQWFIDKVRRLNMLSKAEKVLEEMIELDINNHQKIGDEVVIRKDPALAKIKQDTAKFLAERLGKNDGYSSRTELTGQNGDPLTIVFDESFKK